MTWTQLLGLTAAQGPSSLSTVVIAASTSSPRQPQLRKNPLLGDRGQAGQPACTKSPVLHSVTQSVLLGT